MQRWIELLMSCLVVSHFGCVTIGSSRPLSAGHGLLGEGPVLGTLWTFRTCKLTGGRGFTHPSILNYLILAALFCRVTNLIHLLP